MKISFTICFLILLSSCKQDTVDPEMSKSYMKFMVDAEQVEYSGGCNQLANNEEGVCCSKGTALALDTIIPAYYISGGNPAGDEYILFEIITDSLVSGLYDESSGLFETIFSRNDSLYSSASNPSHFTVNVIRNADATIEGNFAGTLYRRINFTSDFDSIVITNGTFGNVQIVY